MRNQRLFFFYQKRYPYFSRLPSLCTGRSRTGKRILEQHKIDLIILDLGLPDGNGMDLCKEIRIHSKIPIIMLTACDLETDEVSGLLAGADDYITKPFSLSVLRARVEALLRRTEVESRHIICSGKYRLDTNLCKLFREDEEIPISATEYKLRRIIGFPS